jgi:hypothetical protein
VGAEHDRRYVQGDDQGTGLSFDQAVDKNAANKIMSFVLTGSALPEGAGGNGAGGAGAGAGRTPDANLAGLNPKQFIAQKKPKTQYERVACLGYFLHTGRQIVEFGAEEIKAINKDAAQQPILNLPKIMADTTSKYGYLSAAGGGNKQMTVLGDAVVEALPDREAVKTALAEHRTGKKRKKRATKKK